ncbi:putative quinol monooxygenase [Alicyclobacillus acidoterrestris]|uniref:putative quinol monooxygenase n=1 Tax=Alicyclobacillus acidoterrestris TaxID=1450 RepID=UPI003F534EC4
MVIVHARVQCKPDKREALLSLVKGLIEATRTENGCLSYRFYEDTEVQNDFLFVEQWETKEHLDTHSKQPAFLKFQEQAPALITSLDIQSYEVQS